MAYQCRRPVHLIEGLIPKLFVVSVIEPAWANPRMGAVKEEQSVDLVSISLCEVLHYESADVVPDGTRAINVQCIQGFDEVVGIVGDVRNIRGLIAVSKPRRPHNHIETSASAGIFSAVYQNPASRAARPK